MSLPLSPFSLSLSRFLAAFHDRKGMLVGGVGWKTLIPTGVGWNFESILLATSAGTRTTRNSVTQRIHHHHNELSPRLRFCPSFRGPTIVLNFQTEGGSTPAEGGRVLLLRSRAGCYCERLRANSSGEFCACDFRPWRISKIPRDP